MRIKKAKTIQEFKTLQKQKIQEWIDNIFVEGSVTWQMEGALHIKITDKTGDSVIVSLDDID